MKCYHCNGTGEIITSNSAERVFAALKGRNQTWLCIESGVDKGTISRFLRGGKTMTVENLNKICKVLDVSLDWVVNGDESITRIDWNSREEN